MRRASGPSAGGFWPGVVAGIGTTIVLFAWRLATGIPMPQEALAERLVRLLPDAVFTLLLAELQHLAKPAGFATAVGLTLIGFGLGAMIYGRAVRASRRPFLLLAFIAAAATWAVLAYVVMPIIQGGLLGEPLSTTVSARAPSLVLGSAVYGLLLACLYRREQSRVTVGRPALVPPYRAVPAARVAESQLLAGWISRRDLLRRTALILLVVAAASRLGTSARAIGVQAAAAAAGVSAVSSRVYRLIRGMPPEVTSNSRFYQVSKNYPFDPTVRVAEWSLGVTGLVVTPLKFSYAELIKAAPPAERYQTLECVGNPVGGDLIGNARWKGLRVRDILNRARVRPEATAVVWHSADGYSESVPLAVAMDPEALLAYEMNGRPLPRQHGAPVRVLLLNRYGMKQPKWLTGIEVADATFIGRWERQRLHNPAIVKTGSAFRAETNDGGAVLLGGWAFAGRRGIAKVEISPDGGATWFPATVKEALGENCWQFWSAAWTRPAPGEYTLAVRAVDGTGALQAGRRRRMPDGAEGYHEVRVRIPG